MFIDNEIEGFTDTNKNRQCKTSGI